jgi:4-hydroxybenzoate polyprenyltransferase
MPGIVALARSTHPGPTVAVTLLATLLAVGMRLDAVQIALVAIVVLANQVSIGLANDGLDAARDREAGRGDKPVAAGALTPRTVLRVALLAAALSIALSLLLGPWTALANLALLGSGWAYDLGLKATPLSIAPYLVGFGALPAIPAGAIPAAPVWWAVVAAALLGAAAHLANALPDLDDDRRHGIRGLPHVLGRRATLVLAPALVVVAGLLVSISARLGPVGLAAQLLITGAGAAAVLASAGRSHPGSRMPFVFIMLGALGVAIALVVAGFSGSGGRLLA